MNTGIARELLATTTNVSPELLAEMRKAPCVGSCGHAGQSARKVKQQEDWLDHDNAI